MTCYLCGRPATKVAYYGHHDAGDWSTPESCEPVCVDRLYYCANCASLVSSVADPHASWQAEFVVEAR